MPRSTPESRVRAVNDAPVRPGKYVLYWMVACRRTTRSFALDRAVEWGKRLERPLVILEGLQCDYPWATLRTHQFVLDGMRDNAAACEKAGITYLPYLEPGPGRATGLLETLAESASVVVTDDYPTFFLPRLVATAGERLACRLEAVDGNGVLPLSTHGRAFNTAASFRRFVHSNLTAHLDVSPGRAPLRSAGALGRARVARAIRDRWPMADVERAVPSGIPVDREIEPDPRRGGRSAGLRRLREFVDDHLAGYGRRDNPDDPNGSALSPYLHFGHLGTHDVLTAVLDRYGWSPFDVNTAARGQRSGWWGLPAAVESYLDELLTWRELAFNGAAWLDRYDSYEGLPKWARQTLAEHAADPRPHRYTPAQFDGGETHDHLWNAAQNQLRREGTIHSYLRMLWGKKILEWSPTPRQAFETMVHLNNRYATDGRDPNSYAGIAWVLGRYDRPWGPERPIFGKIRYMSSESTRRKLKLTEYVERFGGNGGTG